MSKYFDLTGLKGLIVGIADSNSIAYGCAQILSSMGATLAITYLNDKAKTYTEPLAKELKADLFLPCNVEDESQVNTLFDNIKEKWGKLDFLIHAIAFAPRSDLHGRMVDSSLAGFSQSMNISCHSFARMGKLAEPLMKEGGTLITMSYLGAARVVPSYGMMGVVKAALERTVSYMANDLGPNNIRVNAISPGPIMTRAASGIASFDKLIDETNAKSPLKEELTVQDVGLVACSLISKAGRCMTGNIIYVDRGRHIMT
jgi:enoyl-[acyl-carrier protein] reductase I